MLRTIVFAAPVAVSTVVMPSVQFPHSHSSSRSANTLHGKIPAQGVALPIVGEENPAKVGVALKANPEKIEDFTLHPIGARPDGADRVNDGISAGQMDAQANFGAARD